MSVQGLVTPPSRNSIDVWTKLLEMRCGAVAYRAAINNVIHTLLVINSYQHLAFPERTLVSTERRDENLVVISDISDIFQNVHLIFWQGMWFQQDDAPPQNLETFGHNFVHIVGMVRLMARQIY